MTSSTEFEDEDQAPALEDRALPGNRVRVTLEGEPPYVVRITNRDRVRWDMTYQRQGWPKAEDAPFLAQTFVAWAAAKREGLTDLKFEAFRDRTEDLEGLREVPADADRPTR